LAFDIKPSEDVLKKSVALVKYSDMYYIFLRNNFFLRVILLG
jgi:hypothetical protein